MDARWLTLCICLTTTFVVQGGTGRAASPYVHTQNFVVIDAPNQRIAQRVSQAAERYRKDLAVHWLGKELPPWPSPCTIRVIAGNRPAEGRTDYNRYPGHVGDFQMDVIGSEERILDSVLPHEVTHTVLATYFGKALPRWADEGISTTVEHVSERSKHDAKLREFLTTGRGIPMNQLFMMREYPAEMLTLYAQGYSVCRFLIAQQGPREFIRFLESYHKRGSWTQAVRQHYQYESLAELQQHWLGWVQAGSGSVAQFAKIQPASDNNVALAANNPAAASGQSVGPVRPVATSGSSAPAPTMLAAGSPASDGWYRRRRQQTVQGSAASAVATSSPRSESGRLNEKYSAAQPPEEQGAVSSGYPIGPATRWR